MSRKQRVVLLGLAAVVLVAGVIIALATKSADDSAAGGPKTIVVTNARPVGGVKDLTWKKGQTIDLTIKSDTADEVHFHGYDVHKDVARGASVRFRMPATIEGKFVVELEDHKQTLANVDVEP
jgi:hypothetical protein